VVFIAWSGLLVRWAGIDGLSAAFYRLSIGAVVLAPWSAVRLRTETRPSARTVMLTAVSGALFAFDNALFNIAVQRTAVAVATLLANISPLFVGFGSWLLFRRRPSREFWIDVLLATIGCALIAPPGALFDSTGGRPAAALSGPLLAIVASVFFAGYLLVTEHVRGFADTVTFVSLTVCWSAVLLGLACVVLGAPLHGFSPRTWAALAGLGLVSQVGGYLGITYALGTLPATAISVGLLAQAPVSALIAAVVLGERLSPSQIGGGVLVLAGVYLVTGRSRA